MRIKTNKNIISNAIFIISCLFVYNFFPSKDFFQQTVATITFFILIPIIYKKFILKENIKDFGFRIGDYKEGLKFGSISVLIGFIFFVLILKNTNYLTEYKLPVLVVNNFWFFILYEFLLVPFFVILYEVFFRGFILFSFIKDLGIFSILIQFLVFLILFYVQGMRIEFAPYLIFAPFAGLIAYKSNSIFYSFLTQWLFIFLADTSIIKMLQ